MCRGRATGNHCDLTRIKVVGVAVAMSEVLNVYPQLRTKVDDIKIHVCVASTEESNPMSR